MTSTAEWLDIGWVDQIPVRGSRTAPHFSPLQPLQS